MWRAAVRRTLTHSATVPSFLSMQPLLRTGDILVVDRPCPSVLMVVRSKSRGVLFTTTLNEVPPSLESSNMFTNDDESSSSSSSINSAADLFILFTFDDFVANWPPHTMVVVRRRLVPLHPHQETYVIKAVGRVRSMARMLASPLAITMARTIIDNMMPRHFKHLSIDDGATLAATKSSMYIAVVYLEARLIDSLYNCSIDDWLEGADNGIAADHFERSIIVYTSEDDTNHEKIIV